MTYALYIDLCAIELANNVFTRTSKSYRPISIKLNFEKNMKEYRWNVIYKNI